MVACMDGYRNGTYHLGDSLYKAPPSLQNLRHASLGSRYSVDNLSLNNGAYNNNNGNMVQQFERRASRASAHPLGDVIRQRETYVPLVFETNINGEAVPEQPLKGENGDVFKEVDPTAESDPRPPDDAVLGDRTHDTLFFRDGRRRIDMILVYEHEDAGGLTETDIVRQEKRKMFQESLQKEGLELELEGKEQSFDEKTYFVKIHIPWNTLRKYAEVMNLKMPIKETDTPKDMLTEESCWPCHYSSIFDYDHDVIPPVPSFYMATYSRDREEQFVVKDRETVFSPAQRSLIVWQVLRRAKYDENERVGIRRLLNNGTYLAAFPLHEGRYDRDNPNGPNTDRRLLYLEWAKPKKWYKRQPIFLIKKYFGEKIGLYFAWLGFYTTMLIPASIVGVICFIYGLLSINSKDNIPSREICNKTGPGNITLCPLCDKACAYEKLANSCTFAQMTYLFDNPATVFFAIFMSFWATSFLEMWKRKQAIIEWEWDLQQVEEDEEPRPEFEETVKTYRMNPVTREKEPYLTTWNKVMRYTATGSMVLFMLSVVIAAVLGTIIYRLSVVTVIHNSTNSFFKHYAHIVTSVTAAVINLIVILLLTHVYQKLALFLVNFENPRTQTEFEDSYTFKIFVFQFINFYSSLIYIAFFKGRFFVHPGDVDARKSLILRLRTDICDPAGCLSELFIQLSIIMVGKQALNNFVEIFLPKMRNWWRKRVQRSNTIDQERKYTRWEEDYRLEDGGRLALFEEYLEMVLQYGFVTLFVAAFPLAPLFALINNIGEIRLDAYKMVTQMRRPLAERVKDIGAWYGILQGVTYAAVVSNAFVIAYTSDFIPRMVYSHVYSPTKDLVGYIDSSLSEFNTSDYQADMGSDTGVPDPPTCQYRGYRNGPKSPDKYGLSPQYWHVFAARLAFVVVFEHVVFALTGVMAYAIPDIPAAVHTQIQREKLLAKEAKYDHASHEARVRPIYKDKLTDADWEEGGDCSIL